MMKNAVFKAVFFVLLAPWLLSGCAADMAYRTVQAAAEQACLRQPPSEQAQCNARIIKDDYATYEKNRSRD